MLVDKYLNSINDDRKEHITYVDLEDVGSTPSQENIELARKYGVTATPVIVAVDDNGEFEMVLPKHDYYRVKCDYDSNGNL